MSLNRVVSRRFERWSPPTPKTLLEAKEKNRIYRKMKRIWDAKNEPDQFETDMGVCWMCWMDLTGNDLPEWRKEPYSIIITHSSECPLCGYPTWKGRVWFPFRLLRGYVGNPSSRHGMKKE